MSLGLPPQVQGNSQREAKTYGIPNRHEWAQLSILKEHGVGAANHPTNFHPRVHGY